MNEFRAVRTNLSKSEGTANSPLKNEEGQSEGDSSRC